VQPEFDPPTARRHFTVIASDYVTQVLMAEALKRVALLAPGLSFDVRPTHAAMAQDLDQGRVDLLVAPAHLTLPDHPQQLLFEDTYPRRRLRAERRAGRGHHGGAVRADGPCGLPGRTGHESVVRAVVRQPAWGQPPCQIPVHAVRGCGDANTGDAGTVTATLNGSPFFNYSGSFIAVVSFLEGRGVPVTLRPGPNYLAVSGSVGGCGTSDCRQRVVELGRREVGNLRYRAGSVPTSLSRTRRPLLSGTDQQPAAGQRSGCFASDEQGQCRAVGFRKPHEASGRIGGEAWV
jgi:hypothetical protein